MVVTWGFHNNYRTRKDPVRKGRYPARWRPAAQKVARFLPSAPSLARNRDGRRQAVRRQPILRIGRFAGQAKGRIAL
jgi:hypothetical protein